MRRREYLAVTAASSVTVIAGCSGASTDSNPTSSPSNLATGTPTPTPSEASFEVVDVSATDSVQLREPYTIDVTVENTGGREGTWSGTLYRGYTVNPESSEWREDSIELTIPPGESKTWSSEPVSFIIPTVVHYRVGEEGATRRVDIPQSKAPIIEATNLVTEWDGYGDAVDNRITEASVGSTVTIASRYWYWNENQTQSSFKQVEIYDSENSRVAIDTSSSEQLTDSNGWSSWESYLNFDSTGWGSGRYTAVMRIRDEQSGEVSGTGRVEFQLV